MHNGGQHARQRPTGRSEWGIAMAENTMDVTSDLSDEVTDEDIDDVEGHVMESFTRSRVQDSLVPNSPVQDSLMQDSVQDQVQSDLTDV